MATKKQETRINKIRKRFGKDAFVKFGRKGGSPILRAWKQGRIPKNLVKSKKK